MDTMYIGSGDVSALMSGKNTETHYKLLRRFLSGVKPYYNALNSPIDALRTGAILESRFIKTLSDDWYQQIVVVSEEMDVFKASLDFARMDGGRVSEFIEMKTTGMDDFLEIESMSEEQRLFCVQKKYRHYYEQIQEQLYCSGLQSATLAFVVVYTYDDETNYSRDIEENEVIRIAIQRNESVISEIKSRGVPFQQLKDFYFERI